MEVSSSHQMYVFFLSVLSGLGCGVFFDLQRSLRRLHFAGSIRTTIEDIIFVVVAVGVTIALGFFFNNGQMRYYQVMGSVSGALFYAAFLSRIVMKILKFFYSMLAKIIINPIIRLLKLLAIPARKLWNIIKRTGSKIKKVKKRVSRKVKKGRNLLKKRIKML